MNNIDNILLLDNYTHLSQSQLINIIMVLKDELKYYKFKKDKNIDLLNDRIRELDLMIYQQQQINKTLKEKNVLINKKLFKPLSFKERISGKIDLDR